MTDAASVHRRGRHAARRWRAELGYFVLAYLVYVGRGGSSSATRAPRSATRSGSGSSSRRFTANPIGVSVDPDRMVARADGASPDELHERAFAGEFEPDAPLDLRVTLG